MLKKTLLAAAMLVASAGILAAQIRPNQPDSFIRGRIFLSSGEAAEKIEVRLERTEMQLVGSVYTDSIGNFEFRNLLPNNYYIVVKVDGFDEARQLVESSTVSRGGVTLTITLNKTPVFRAQPEVGEDVVDITDLQRKYPKKAVQEYEKAIEELRKGDARKSIELMEDVVKAAPDFYQAHNNLGVGYQRLNRFEDAAREYKAARGLNPRATEPLVNLGSLYIQEADSRREEGNIVTGRILDAALDILDEAVKADAQSAPAYYYLGSAYYKSDFPQEAEKNLLKSQQLDPKARPVRLMLVNVYMKMGKWESVLAQLNAYLAENPKASDRAQMEQMRSQVLQGLQALKK